MEEILDQSFKEKDERWINRGVALIRLLIFLYFCCFMLQTQIMRQPLPSSATTIQVIIIIFLPTSFVLVTIHSFYRILSEFSQRFIISKENRVIALFMIIVYFTLGGLSYYAAFDMTRPYYENQSFSNLSIQDVELFLFAMGLSIITFREIIYYQRATRLKRLKNTKP